jgi:hypothetical protein
MTTTKIPELNLEVETELRKRVKKSEIKIPKGWRLLTFSEASYILEKNILKLGLEKIEWITLKDKVASLDSDMYGDRLNVNGYSWSDLDIGCGFGVRFCKEIKK